MRKTLTILLTGLVIQLPAQGPDLIGYWHNWNDGNAPYLELSQVDSRYSVVCVSFALPAPGTTYDMVFAPQETAPATFIADVSALQAEGRKVLISIGGATGTVHLDSDAERDQFVSSLLGIIGTYGFDGIDIDLEGASVAISGGTIANPIDARIVRLIDAVHVIADQFEVTYGVPMMLTMAPETAYVQGGMSAYGGIWGAYLPIIDALRERLDILQVQLYNSGSMYGIDGGIYTQGTADFIVSQTEALLQGFSTSGGSFAPLPPEKVAIGLPACPSAAGGGYVTPLVLEQAVDYLRGIGPQPGSYQRIASYPSLRGLMTWSINWDAAPGCASANEFAQAFEDIYGITTSVEEVQLRGILIWPMPVDAGVLNVSGLLGNEQLLLLDATGRRIAQLRTASSGTALPVDVPAGAYVLRIEREGMLLANEHVVVLR
ncbi:MAG TPA: chitinase [Flavobacteriales bacterium]|nr:chitinase [Flavobacteriales bacterium]